MTTDEARKAAAKLSFDRDLVGEIASLVVQAVQAEREACAKVADFYRDTSSAAGDLALEKGDIDDHQSHAQDGSIARYIAAAIRHRNET